MKRRDFIKEITGISAGALFAIAIDCKNNESDKYGELLPLRPLGKTGEYVTMLGLGGWHIGLMQAKEAEQAIETAIAGGIRFFDTAEQYGKGESEKRYGKYLVPKYRDDIFLMTKTRARNAEDAREHLEGSLSRLNTDYLDLWQMHSIKTPLDVDERLDNGVYDFVKEMQAQGKVRYIGFTGHHRPEAHQRMLERVGGFDTCQMPVNVLDPNYFSFIRNVLPLLEKKNITCLAMKTLSNGRFFGKQQRSNVPQDNIPNVIPDHLSIQEALHFVWSLSVSVLITGPDNIEQLKEKIQLAKSFKPLDASAREALVGRVAEFAGGQVEYYKR